MHNAPINVEPEWCMCVEGGREGGRCGAFDPHPQVFDCQIYGLYVLYSEINVPNWGDLPCKARQ